MAEGTDLSSRTTDNERDSDEIRRDIAARRQSISATVDRIGERLEETLDWRGYVERNPYVALGLAAGVGFLFSALVSRRRPPPRARILDALSETVEDLAVDLQNAIRPAIVRATKPGLVKGAISAIVVKAAMDLLKEQVLGRADAQGQPYPRSSVSRPPESA